MKYLNNNDGGAKLNGKEWWELYTKIVQKHVASVVVKSYDDISIAYKKALEELASLCDPKPTVETVIERLDWEEHDEIYRKLHKMGHRIY